MNISKFFIALLITLTFSFNATATIITTTTNVSIAVHSLDGGPRTVIQAMTDISVNQESGTKLYTTILNSDGAAVIEAESEEVSTVISVEGLESGTYTVETVDEDGDYQAFSITVE